MTRKPTVMMSTGMVSFFESACDTELDCDDENAEIHPAADEICDDRIDNDCDENDGL